MTLSLGEPSLAGRGWIQTPHTRIMRIPYKERLPCRMVTDGLSSGSLFSSSLHRRNSTKPTPSTAVRRFPLQTEFHKRKNSRWGHSNEAAAYWPFRKSVVNSPRLSRSIHLNMILSLWMRIILSCRCHVPSGMDAGKARLSALINSLCIKHLIV